jgi:hypothetical protein
MPVKVNLGRHGRVKCADVDARAQRHDGLCKGGQGDCQAGCDQG